ncbi:MAG TPA: protein kinase [Actinomycetota bacterium]|nr:protein kinase [Actinomycetota bacterium]
MIDVRLAGRYRLEAEVGSGGMTAVWQAMDEVLERPVAVKILHRHLLSNEVLCERFRQEARGAGALTHPGILAVYDTGHHDEAPYIVMEYVAGGSLAQALDRLGPLPPARVATIGADVCEALAYAHRAGVVHGDLKPDNILFSEAGPQTGQVKVGDFGVGAAALGGDLTATGALIGTLSFLAPEVLDGQDPSPAADIYALGVVLFKALTGRSPRGASRELTGVGPGRLHPRDFRPDVPRDLDAAVAGALAVEPEERFTDAAQLGQLLRSASMSRALHPPTPATAPPPRPPEPAPSDVPSFVRSEGRWLAPVVLLVLAAIAIVIGVLQLSGHLTAITGGGAPATTAPAVSHQPIPLQAGGAVKEPGDSPEHPDQVGQAFDGNASTFWHSQAYNNATFGNLGYSGVGIWGDLGSSQSLSSIEVDSPAPGWQGSIRYSDDGKAWSDPGPAVTAGATQTFDVSKDGAHQYWMVWITKLPTAPDGSFTAEVSEIKALR